MVTINWRIHPGQRQVWRSKARFKVVGCGRRWGKTEFGWKKLLTEALKAPGPYGWIVPWYKELRPVTNTIDDSTPLSIFTVRRKIAIGGIPVYRYLELPNGSQIYLNSADLEDSLRGVKYRGVVLDEAPSIKRSRWEKEIAPSLMDYGGWAIFIGSPKGRNWFHELYLRGQDRDAHPEWESWRQTSYANTKGSGGFLDKAEIDLIRSQLPELAARQEIMAEFLQDAGVVFRNVEACRAGATGDPEPYRRYTVGVDLAKTMDWTVLVALDDTGHVRGFERFNQLDWGFQKSRIKSFAKRYSGLMVIDSTGVGDPIYDDLSRDDVKIQGFKFTSESKRQLIENLSIAFDKREITYPRGLDVLENELKAYTYELTPGGNVRYGAPEGLHDDAVTALALALWGRAKTPEPAFIFG